MPNEIGLSFLVRFDIYYFAFAKNFDCRVGADDGTNGTAGAIHVDCFGWEVTAFVGFFREGDAVFRAYRYTQAAALAPLNINNYLASHRIFLFTAELAVLGTPYGEHAEVTFYIF
jgi:hypothetical protein